MKILFTFFCLAFITTCTAQVKKVELYDLMKKFIQDSSLYSSVGDWGVSTTGASPVQWQGNTLNMSDDLKINFFRKGTANILINGASYGEGTTPAKWDVMLMGARSGFSSFTITSPYHKNLKAKTPIDSLFANKPYSAKTLQDCSAKPAAGFYYYKVNIPKKSTAYVKVSWNCNTNACSIRIDCYDDWSRQYADLVCGR